MSEKGNPLDRLTRPGGRPLSDDESIPVLTERLSLPSLDLDISLPKPPPPVAAPPPPPPVAAPPPLPVAVPVPAPVAAPVPEPVLAPLAAPPPPAPVRAPAPPPPPPAALPPVPVASAPARPTVASPTPRPAAAAPQVPTYASTPTELPPVPEVDWAQIEQSMREALYRELQPALADEAARLLKDRLQPALERVVLAASAELRQSFEQRLRELITRAVAAEIARHRTRS